MIEDDLATLARVLVEAALHAGTDLHLSASDVTVGNLRDNAIDLHMKAILEALSSLSRSHSEKVVINQPSWLLPLASFDTRNQQGKCCLSVLAPSTGVLQNFS